MFLQYLLLALLASTTVAASGSQCTKNKCYSSVSRASAAKSDCSSFQRAYVTPCSETRTRTITIIHTVSATPSSTQTITETSYDSIVKTTTTTITSTTTTTKAGQAVRDAKPRPQTTSCSGLTVKPTSTPTYASACGGTKSFASACSCIGIPPTTTTLIPATTTATVFTDYTTTVGGDPVTVTTTTTATTTGTITATQVVTTTTTATAPK